uniref:Uncharacterized protein n=1 Tax=Biomphalaria glabrata TaxID=6526 RepID=A0A2C9KWV1_BIOGL
MSEHDPRCQIFLEDKCRRAMENCHPEQACVPADMTRVPIRAPPPMNPMDINCGCPPMAGQEYCCNMPGTVETRILRRPMRCVRPPCNYCIPAVPCNDPPKKPYRPRRDPLCFDWTVHEVGPNDSYGHHGLNWYDWGKMRELHQEHPTFSTTRFTHPGLSEGVGLITTREYLCRLPLMCYSRAPSSVKKEPFAQDVDYFRDWRSCTDKTTAPWKPPYAQWATNQNL